MEVRYVISGTLTLPEGAEPLGGMDNWFRIKGKLRDGAISVAPVILFQNLNDDGTLRNEPVDFTPKLAESHLDVKLDLYDKSLKDLRAGVGEDSVTLADLTIGTEFRYRDMEVTNKITDIGTRTATYIRLDQEDHRNYNGPPYSVVEHVLDEDDIRSIKIVSGRKG